MTLFQHCSVLFELKGLPFKEKNKIKLRVTDNGGTISFVPNKECSLIVTSDVSSLSPNRLRNIVKHQIPVVGLNYVSCCLEANLRLPVDDFKLDISSPYSVPAHKDKQPQSTVTSTESKGQAKPQRTLSVIQKAESSKGRESIFEYRVYTETDQSLPKFPENFQVAKYSIFEKPNSSSWCVLELQSTKTEGVRQYRVVRYWKDNVQTKRAAVRDQIVFLSTSEEAVKVYQASRDSLKADGLKQRSHAPPQVTEMGSAPLQQLLLEEKLHTGELSQEVGVFVELLWQEAVGCLELILKTPVHKISLNDVTRAEGLLLQIHKKLTQNEKKFSLWLEYCTLLPQQSPSVLSIHTVSKELDRCQLIRDILNVTEMTLGTTVPSSVGKYRALRCSIEAVPKGTLEFKAVTSQLQHSEIQVLQILRINRAAELQNFRSELGNVESLLHSSSPHNFVGILSRGLLLPHVAVEHHGVTRTDAGNLGSGIYFSDDISTILKYSQCSMTDGSRMLLVCDVALGRCKQLFKKDLTLTQAPEGHDSVHGVQNMPGRQSEFMDNEYVVYSPDQVRMKYVVQFILKGDELKNFTPEIIRAEEPSIPSADQEVEEVEDAIDNIKSPLENVTAGLLNSSGQQIPLQAVHVKCKLMDLLSQVIIFQTYTNQSSVPIEAKYVFPLDDYAAVCGFEAFINGKHVVGKVKEKETARREYKQAIEKGHGAYLMDQDAPDVFTISVGNLPPGATVLIKITFVSELIVKDGSIFFSLPGSVAPWQESSALNQTTQVTVEKVCVTEEGANTREFKLDMSIEMPHEITKVECFTHKVRMKKTDCKAVVSVMPGEVMGPEGFQLSVTLTEVHMPRMWVEKHPDKDSQACMLVFYPSFEVTTKPTSDEVVLMLDASQSMKGESLNTAQRIALQFLKTLDRNVRVNIIFFGTDHTEAFLSARELVEAHQDAMNFIKRFSSAGGSTELWRPLRALSLLPPTSGTRNLLLLSDGHIQNTELTLQLLRDNVQHSRLFTCGLSPTANRHFLRALAHAGGGTYEFFDPKTKHTWSEKVASQVKRMMAPGARSVSVKWQQFNPTAPPPVQAPKQVHALFNDCHTLVFGFVPHCTQATLHGNLSGQEIKTMVSTTELQKTKGTFLHKLTARALIRDYEDGSLDSNASLHESKKKELKSFVIELSKEFSILSQFTSFVAIEERDSGEEQGFTDVPKLIAEEDVDFLPYMSWMDQITYSEDELQDIEESWSEVEEMGEDYSFDIMEKSRSPELEYAYDELMEIDENMIDEVKSPWDEDFTLAAASSSLMDMSEDKSPPRVDLVFERDSLGMSGYCIPYCGASPKVLPPSAPQIPVRTPITGVCRSSAPDPSAPLFPLQRVSASTKTWASKSKRLECDVSVEKQPPPPPVPPMFHSFAESGLDLICQTPEALPSPPPPPPPPPPAVLPYACSAKADRRDLTGLLAKEMSEFKVPTFSSAQTQVQPPLDLSLSYCQEAAPIRGVSLGTAKRKEGKMAGLRLSTRKNDVTPELVRLSSFSFCSSETNALSKPPQKSSLAFHAEPKIRVKPHHTRSPAKEMTEFQVPTFSTVVKSSLDLSNSLEEEAATKVKSSLDLSNSLEEEAAPMTDTSRTLDTIMPQSCPPLVSCGAASGSLFGTAKGKMADFVTPRINTAEMELSALVSPYGSVAMQPVHLLHQKMNVTQRSIGPLSFDYDSLETNAFSELQQYQKYSSPATKPPPTTSVQRSNASRKKNRSICFNQRPRPVSEKTLKKLKWRRIFDMQHSEGYWELTSELGTLINCNISRFANDFLKKKGIESLGVKAHADILKLLATLLVLQLMRLEKCQEGQMLRTLLCLEDCLFRPDHWEAVNRAVKWARWADSQYPCVYSRLEFGQSWDSSTKQLLGFERIPHLSPLTGLNLNSNPVIVH